MMTNAHYFSEAEVLSRYARSPEECISERARELLMSARALAAQFAFPAVANWITALLNEESCKVSAAGTS